MKCKDCLFLENSKCIMGLSFQSRCEQYIKRISGEHFDCSLFDIAREVAPHGCKHSFSCSYDFDLVICHIIEEVGNDEYFHETYCGDCPKFILLPHFQSDFYDKLVDHLLE